MMKNIKFILLTVLLILNIFNLGYTEVIGELTYKKCLDDCFSKYLKIGNSEIYFLDYNKCKENSLCCECVDKCMQELISNNPMVAKELIIEKTQTIKHNCFINIIM